MPAPFTVTAGMVKRLLHVGLRDGVHVDAVRRATRLFPALVDDPDGRIDHDRLLDLWAYLGKILDDPSLPIRVAELASIEDLHVLGFAVMTAPTIRESLDTFTRYGALLTEAGRWEVSEVGRRFDVRWLPTRPPTLGQRLGSESALAQFVKCVRQMTGERVEPLEVSIGHSAPRYLAAHRAFFRCRVRFDAPYDGLSLDREILDAAPATSNEALWHWLCHRADALCGELRPRQIADAVRHHVVRGLLSHDGGVPSSSHVAHALGITERTMRRRLRAQGTSFRRLVEDVRRERTGRLLQGGRTVTEAALCLGFSDTSAFTHACRRWFDTSPRALRARLNTRS